MPAPVAPSAGLRQRCSSQLASADDPCRLGGAGQPTRCRIQQQSTRVNYNDQRHLGGEQHKYEQESSRGIARLVRNAVSIVCKELDRHTPDADNNPIQPTFARFTLSFILDRAQANPGVLPCAIEKDIQSPPWQLEPRSCIGCEASRGARSGDQRSPVQQERKLGVLA